MLRTIFAIASASFAFLLFGLPAFAKTNSKIAEECLSDAVIAGSSEADEILEEVLSWSALYSNRLIEMAEDCVAKLGMARPYVKGEGFIVDPLRIEQINRAKEIRAELERLEQRVSSEDYKTTLQDELCALSRSIEDAKKVISARQAVKKERESEVANARFKACVDLYDRDQTMALLNPICHQTFLANGLPDTELEGPSYFELLNAEIQKSGSEIKAASILNSQMSMEDANRSRELNAELDALEGEIRDEPLDEKRQLTLSCPE